MHGPKSLIRDQRGATTVEYGLIMALIFLAMVVAIRGFAQTSTNMWENVANEVAAVRP